MGRPEGKRQLGRSRSMRVHKIKIYLLEAGYDCVEWIGLAQDRVKGRALVIAAMKLRFL
jgi:hypothetical protein